MYRGPASEYPLSITNPVQSTRQLQIHGTARVEINCIGGLDAADHHILTARTTQDDAWSLCEGEQCTDLAFPAAVGTFGWRGGHFCAEDFVE